MNSSRFTLTVPIIEVHQLTTEVFLHIYQSPQIAQTAKPGQFVMVRVVEGVQPFLPRPFCIAGVDKRKQTFSILCNIRGEGTRLLAKKSVGESVRLFGPLGQGFSIDKTCNQHTLIAGGIGIAPLIFLLQELNTLSVHKTLVYAARSKQNILLRDELERLADDVCYITEDGSLGKKGIATDFLDDYLKPESAIYVCGPSGFYEAFIQIARAKELENCQLSLEQQMACGVGACLGCVVNTRAGYQRVCTEGPVFPLSTLI